ncbi:cytochrome b5 [Spodoptera frugiperda]|uniref:Cytochrome b5 n=1 Tax=Spodoptera frugiperda TaxID=7108 RepID=A0A9R0DB61_SPOFR|nr:cytochrome b5 [Spodoptera frugiperda]
MILIVMISGYHEKEGAAGSEAERTARLWARSVAVSSSLRSEQAARAANMTSKQFTREEISKWKSENKTDTVFIIDNVVYDVTKFLDEHPGGHEVLQNVAGKDASEDFDDVGHSLDAKDLMQKYKVGEIVESERVYAQKRQISWEDNKQENDSSFTSSWKFPVLLGIVVTLLYSYLFG